MTSYTGGVRGWGRGRREAGRGGEGEGESIALSAARCGIAFKYKPLVTSLHSGFWLQQRQFARTIFWRFPNIFGFSDFHPQRRLVSLRGKSSDSSAVTSDVISISDFLAEELCPAGGHTSAGLKK